MADKEDKGGRVDTPTTARKVEPAARVALAQAALAHKVAQVMAERAEQLETGEEEDEVGMEDPGVMAEPVALLMSVSHAPVIGLEASSMILQKVEKARVGDIPPLETPDKPAIQGQAGPRAQTSTAVARAGNRLAPVMQVLAVYLIIPVMRAQRAPAQVLLGLTIRLIAHVVAARTRLASRASLILIAVSAMLMLPVTPIMVLAITTVRF